MTQDIYEFSDDENRTISTLVRQMANVGALFIVTGLLLLAWFLLAALSRHNEIAALPLATFFIANGVLTLRSQRDFRRIVDTKGNDILHTMHALSTLRRVYALTFWLLMICLLIILLGIPAATEIL